MPMLATTHSEIELYRALPKAPSAFSLTVRKLIGRVLEGAVRVPKFQRPLRWKSQDVIKLFDSILKGYRECSSSSPCQRSCRPQRYHAESTIRHSIDPAFL